MAGKYLACLYLALISTLTVHDRYAQAQDLSKYDVDQNTGYRMERYRAPVPDNLPGGLTLDNLAAKALHDQQTATFIDVYPPQGLGPDPLSGRWLTNDVRYSLPGAVWLPETGRGHLEEDALRYFSENLNRLTTGDKGKALVFFCTADCWQSWNAARRALELGFTQVFWYPQGTDGWREEGLTLQPVEPVNFLSELKTESRHIGGHTGEHSATLQSNVFPETARVFLVDQQLNQQAIGIVRFAKPGNDVRGVEFIPEDQYFEDQFLSMRPFRCLTGDAEWFCHLPYPYELPEPGNGDRLTDLEYQLLFIWKSAGSFGIDPWNGIYYQLEFQQDGTLTGQLMQGDLNVLANPPAAGAYPIDLNEFTAEDSDKRRFPSLLIRP